MKKKNKRAMLRICLQLTIIGIMWAFVLQGEWILNNIPIMVTGLGVCVGLIIAMSVARKKHIKKKYLNSPLSKIDTMTGIEFEEYLKTHFESKGYKVKLTPKTNDYGADLILKKGIEKTVVQAKRWNEKVGNSAVQEVVSAKGYYKASKAMVITNSYYTSNAVSLAKANGVELWDRNNIVKLLNVPKN